MKPFGFLINNAFTTGFLFFNCLNLHGLIEQLFRLNQIKQQDLL